MRRFGHPILAVLLACAFAAPAANSAPARPATAKPGAWTPKTEAAPPGAEEGKGRRFIGTVLDSGQFLPDTTVMMRVGPRTIRAREFVELYFDSYAEFRPASDSLGRLEFMQNLVNREVMALVAHEANPPLRFEDRAVLREYSQRVYSNVLMQRAVVDSVKVDEDQIRRVYDQMAYEQRFRHIVFRDGATASQVREQLVAGKLKWADAHAKYDVRKGEGALGDIGFVARDKLELPVRFALYALEPGAYSQPFQDPEGWHVVQVTERRPVSRVALPVIRPLLERQVRDLEVALRSTRLQDQMRARFGVSYDSTNIAYAAALFAGTVEVRQSLADISLSRRIPAIAPEDTSRILARHAGGEVSLGSLVHHYRHISPLLRQPMNTPTLLRVEVDAMMLEPYRARVALERGLDKDPLAVTLVERRREALLVERLYEDSVNSKVSVTSDMRRKYYQDNLHRYVTSPSIRFAIFFADHQPAADSLVASLRAGVKPEEILRADSLGGRKRGSIQSQMQHEEQLPYHKQIFEDLKIGQVGAFGPDENGATMVIQPLEWIDGRQLSYAEAERYVDESVQNEESERLLKAFIARHAKRFPIETRPDLVMKLRWIDPVSLASM